MKSEVDNSPWRLANLVFWLLWIRSSEAFNSGWEDLGIERPDRTAPDDRPERLGYNEAIDKQYLKSTLWQRLQITLRCQ